MYVPPALIPKVCVLQKQIAEYLFLYKTFCSLPFSPYFTSLSQLLPASLVHPKKQMKEALKNVNSSTLSSVVSVYSHKSA